jgi:hypothetical protein
VYNINMRKPIEVEQKCFIVRKYIYASSLEEALLKERSTKVDDAFVDTTQPRKTVVE